MASDLNGVSERSAQCVRIPELILGDLEPIEHRFEYRGKMYVVREASEGVKTMHTNHFIKATATRQDGTPIYRDMDHADIEPEFVSRCVFLIDQKDDNKEKPVTVAEVKRWPSRLVTPLYKWLKDVSGMNLMVHDSVELVKNEIESLEKRIEGLKESLERMNTKKESEKNSPCSTEDTSD